MIPVTTHTSCTYAVLTALISGLVACFLYTSTRQYSGSTAASSSLHPCGIALFQGRRAQVRAPEAFRNMKTVVPAMLTISSDLADLT